jgi:hypothetical protein
MPHIYIIGRQEDFYPEIMQEPLDAVSSKKDFPVRQGAVARNISLPRRPYLDAGPPG